MTEAQKRASKKYLAANKDKYTTLSLRVKPEEKQKLIEQAGEKSLTQYILERCNIRGGKNMIRTFVDWYIGTQEGNNNDIETNSGLNIADFDTEDDWMDAVYTLEDKCVTAIESYIEETGVDETQLKELCEADGDGGVFGQIIRDVISK